MGKIKDKLKEFPIPQVQNDDYSDEDIKRMLIEIRERIIWAKKNPDKSDSYEALGKDYQEFYAAIQDLADHRGIIVDDPPED